jgi:caffeoyl-CoA O-methyltransferase
MVEIIPPKIESYCEENTTAPADLLRELESYTRKNCRYAGMMVGAIEGRLLKLLVQMTNARYVLEIGTFTGYSALCMAEALPESGKLITCDIDEETTKIARSFIERSVHGQKIDIRLGPALETIDALAREAKLDMVFIDADKENYVDYYEAVLPRVRVNGLIVADNVLWSGRILEPKEDTDRALARFNAHVQNDSRVENVLLSVRDGVSIIRKR